MATAVDIFDPALSCPPTARQGQSQSQAMDVSHILLRKGLVTEEQLAEVRRHPTSIQGKPLHRALIDLGLLDEATVLAALAEALGMPFVDLSNVQIDPAILV